MARRYYGPERKPDPNRVAGNNLRVKYPGEPLPKVPECIKKVEESGFKFSHRGLGRTWIFANPNRWPYELKFTLRELREAYWHGF